MTQSILDLDDYFQRDIVEFLDRKKELAEQEAQGSTSEMLSALEENNVALAEKLIEEAVADYNNLGTHDVYKEIYFKKILEMTRQAIEFLNLHPQQNQLRDTIELLIKSGELSGATEKITVLEHRKTEQEEAKINAKEQENQFAEKIYEKIRDISSGIAISIRKKDLRSAISSYKDLKMYFEQFPSGNLERKQEIYNDLLSFYMQINKLKKEIEEEKKKSLADKKRLELANASTSNKYLRLAEISSIINQIKFDVKNSDFNSATQKILELRQITAKIPEQYKHIRSILNSKIDVIVARVEFVKRMKNHN